MFEKVLVGELIPYIDANFRTLTDTAGRPYDFRASTDGFVTLLFFGYTSCPDVCPLHMGNIATVLREVSGEVEEKVKVVFASCGSRENPGNINANHAALNSIGLKNTAYVSPDTAHEFQTWRRSLHQFAPLLFRD